MPFSRQGSPHLALPVVFPWQHLFLSQALCAIWNLHWNFQTFPPFSCSLLLLPEWIFPPVNLFLIMQFSHFSRYWIHLQFPHYLFSKRLLWGVLFFLGVILELMTPTCAFQAIIKVQNFEYFLDTTVAFLLFPRFFYFFFPPPPLFLKWWASDRH